MDHLANFVHPKTATWNKPRRTLITITNHHHAG
jgi:hypothetical protein